MTDTETLGERAAHLLDAHLPRRDPRYDAARFYLIAYLSTDPATRRLCMRALKESPDPDPTKAPAAPAAAESDPTSGAVPARAPVAPLKAVLSCGGKACEDRGGIEIHRQDASCSKFAVTKRTAR